MAIVSLTTIKNWFKTGLKPTQEQFWATWDSFFHKDDKIPIAQIDGIQNVYDLINQINQNSINIIKKGDLIWFKHPNSTNNKIIQQGDMVLGFVEGVFLNAGEYLSGDVNLLSSYIGF